MEKNNKLRVHVPWRKVHADFIQYMRDDPELKKYVEKYSGERIKEAVLTPWVEFKELVLKGDLEEYRFKHIGSFKVTYIRAKKWVKKLHRHFEAGYIGEGRRNTEIARMEKHIKEKEKANDKQIKLYERYFPGED